MAASILDGKSLAEKLKVQIKEHVAEHIQQGYRAPSLAVILVGEDVASTIYINNKRKACQEVGFNSSVYTLPTITTEQELLLLIETLNQDNAIDGILGQLPLPAHINTQAVITQINPFKDVDGFHPFNMGKLAQGNPYLRPCTPLGIMVLLEANQLSVAGKHAVIIGASNIVGKPMALELINAHATVTICRRATTHLEHHVRMADIIVVATGKTDVINTEWLQPHQILIDIGIHRRADGTLHGDVDFLQAQKKVAWITPVPGGAGPMTICMLLQNTLNASISLQSNHSG